MKFIRSRFFVAEGTQNTTFKWHKCISTIDSMLVKKLSKLSLRQSDPRSYTRQNFHENRSELQLHDFFELTFYVVNVDSTVGNQKKEMRKVCLVEIRTSTLCSCCSICYTYTSMNRLLQRKNITLQLFRNFLFVFSFFLFFFFFFNYFRRIRSQNLNRRTNSHFVAIFNP